jgi:tetratricopeptide (TPR) repeat protein
MDPQPPSDSGALDELVVQAIAALETDGEAGLEALLAGFPQVATAIRSRIEALRATGLLDAPGDAPPERLGPFKLIRPLGAGGMGIVYLAVQEDLGREVALKVIRPEQIYFPGARKRFRREVEIVASLQHPGIVPIHTVGEAGGVPYFSMDLLHGETLSAVIARLAKREVATLTGADLAPESGKLGYLYEGSWEDACVRVIQQVAQALEYAHQRGVVHRDIKPSNILLTSDAASRAVLLDFGLAASKQAGELTRTGTMMGSLKYMAPEQARGAADEIGPRTDVYSLGATLFELLTLKTAVAGESETEVLRSIEAGATRRVRALNSRAAPELETVCMTALELDPERRYASAADFARDLGAVLARRPIEARRAGLARRTVLYVRRSPMRAAALGLAALLVVGGPTVFAWQQRSAAKVIAAQRDRAERNAARAMEAVDRMLTRVGDIDLRFVPQMEVVRRAVLEDAVALLEEFVEQEGADRQARTEAARAHARLGSLMSELGRTNEAAQSLQRAIDALRGLIAEQRDPRLEDELAATLLARADALVSAGLGEQAFALLDDADVEFREEGASVSMQASAVRARQLRGQAAIAAGRATEGRELLESAAHEGDALLAAHPDDLKVQRYATSAWNEYGLVLLRNFTPENSGNEEAERALERAIELGEPLAAREAGDPNVQAQLATMRNNFAGALRRRGQFAAAREVYEVALAETEDLTTRFPGALRYKLELATVLNQIGLSHDYENETELAEPYYARTVQLLEELTHAAPHDALLWHRLGIARENLGAPKLKRGDAAAAIALLQTGVEASRRALEIAPDNTDFQGSIQVRARRLVMTQLDAGDFRGAVASAELGPQLAPAPWKSWTGAAVSLSHALDRVRKAPEFDEGERAWFEKHCPERAVHMLRRAMERGVPGPRDLRQLKDLAALQGTPAFDAYVDELLAAPDAQR